MILIDGADEDGRIVAQYPSHEAAPRGDDGVLIYVIAQTVGREHMGVLVSSGNFEKYYGIGLENSGGKGKYGFEGISYFHGASYLLREHRRWQMIPAGLAVSKCFFM